MDALNATLPIGINKIEARRSLTTESLAVFMPFKVQEIQHEHGIYQGVNVISKNMIVVDRKKMLNGNCFILGVSGSGKSFTAKEEIVNILLSTNADVIIIDRCLTNVYKTLIKKEYEGKIPTLTDLCKDLKKQEKPDAQELATAIELFASGTHNTFGKQTNVNIENRLLCYDILELGKHLLLIGMLVVLDSILNRITKNRAEGKETYIFINEIYLLFEHECIQIFNLGCI